MTNTLEKLTDGLNPAQKKAVQNPLHSCTKIVAGAGTGKTKIISKRFAKLCFDLIEKGISSPTSKILVITFTDKAAGEMKDRIIKELDANELNSYGDELWISTFHGFCNKILRKHAIEANLAPDFEIADENTLENVYQNIIKTLKYNEYTSIENLENICNSLNLSSEILEIQNLKKLNAIHDLDKVFADILNTIKKIKSLGLTPKEFLDTTLCATEKFTKVVKTLPFTGITKEEYLSDWYNHLKPYIDDFCRFELDGAFDKLSKKSELLCKNGSSKAEKWTPGVDFPDCINNFYETEIYLIKVIALVYAIYQNRLENLNLVDFDDLINKTIQIFKQNNTIRKHYQEFFKHLIIDEFQDTNGSQLDLIKLLLDENNPNITFVGDRKQSIYGFRYAQMENLDVLHRYIEEKYKNKFEQIKLETNYRSNEHVLSAVNYVTTDHLDLDETLNPADFNLTNETNKFVKNTEITDFNSSIEQKETEAKYIASEIKRLKAEEKNAEYKDFAILVTSHSASETIEKVLSSYGIPSIKKTNTGFFEHPTIKNAIAVLRLIKNPLDEIALTRILKISFSDKQLFELKRSIDNDFSKITDTPVRKLNLCEKIIKLYENNSLKQQELQTIFSTISTLIKEKYHISLLQLFMRFGAKNKLYTAKTEIENFRSEINLRIFEKIIADYEQNKNFTTISNFLEYFEKISQDKYFELPTVTDTGIDAVQIMTIHASKGLEFPYTFVCAQKEYRNKANGNIILDLQYGRKPGFGLIVNKLYDNDSPKSILYKEIWEKPRGENEDLRLFYVAVSRAKKYLNILTFTKKTHNNPAKYTDNFPAYIIKETVKTEDIKIEEATVDIPSIPTPSTIKVLDNHIDTKEKTQNHNFSFSKLNSFIDCENKFLLKYKYNFPSLKTANRAAQIGTIVHKLIYNSFIHKTKYDQTTLKEIFSTLKIEPENQTTIIKAYNNFLNSDYTPEKLSSKKISAERSFKFEYKLNDQSIEFSGDIDLLVENEDKTYTIIDFKTNKYLDKEKENYYKQLYLYKKAIEAEGLNVRLVAIISLGGEKPYKIQPENEAKIEKEFSSTLYAAIQCYNSGLGAKDTTKCATCEYKYICN